MKAINIIFDGPPSHDSGRFVEVETDDGRSINIGEWIERPDEYWALRITELPSDESIELSPPTLGDLLREEMNKANSAPLKHKSNTPPK